jgi:hypothetical protein
LLAYIVWLLLVRLFAAVRVKNLKTLRRFDGACRMGTKKVKSVNSRNHAGNG